MTAMAFNAEHILLNLEGRAIKRFNETKLKSSIREAIETERVASEDLKPDITKKL